GTRTPARALLAGGGWAGAWSLPGFPFGGPLRGMGVPFGDGVGEPGAVLGVAGLIVGRPCDQAAVGNGLVAGPACPPEVPRLPRRLGLALADGVGVGGVADRRAFAVWIGAGRKAKGTLDLLPAMPGLSGLAGIVAGPAFGGELDVSGGAGTGEGLDVPHSGFLVASEHRPGDSLCPGVAGEPDRLSAGCLPGRPYALRSVLRRDLGFGHGRCAPFVGCASQARPRGPA